MMKGIPIANCKVVELLCLQNSIRIQSISNYNKIYLADKSHT